MILLKSKPLICCFPFAGRLHCKQLAIKFQARLSGGVVTRGVASTSQPQDDRLSKLLSATSSLRDDGSLAIVSLSNDIYLNLALENYIAESLNTKTHRNILLLWQSEPCIVIGRHQNPWSECNARAAHLSQVKVARRYSGGGCVYHDLGNLNMSFICDRMKYDRKLNLDLIKNTLDSCNFANNIAFNVSPRHDIFMNVAAAAAAEDTPEQNFKISGSAARLAHKFSYHHCTLLFDSDMRNMQLLRSNLLERITSNATKSVRSPVVNIRPHLAEPSNMNMDELIVRLCRQYWSLHSNRWSSEFLFHYVNPADGDIFPHLETSLSQLKSWQHVYGQTPKFKLNVPLERSELVFHIENAVVEAVDIVRADEIDDVQLRHGINLLLKCRFHLTELTKAFEAHNIAKMNSEFVRLLEFFNQNIH